MLTKPVAYKVCWPYIPLFSGSAIFVIFVTIPCVIKFCTDEIFRLYGVLSVPV